MAGYSFIVTVSAPNAPCTQTQASVSVGHHGEIAAPGAARGEPAGGREHDDQHPTPVAR